MSSALESAATRSMMYLGMGVREESITIVVLGWGQDADQARPDRVISLRSSPLPLRMETHTAIAPGIESAPRGPHSIDNADSRLNGELSARSVAIKANRSAFARSRTGWLFLEDRAPAAAEHGPSQVLGTA